MKRTRPRVDIPTDGGSALVETVGVTIGLFLPLVWTATCLVRVEAGEYAARTASRQAVRAYATAPTSSVGARRAESAARLALIDQHLDPADGRTRVRCTAQPCLTPGARIEATSLVEVPVPYLPTWLGAGLTVARATASAVEVVEQYGGRR